MKKQVDYINDKFKECFINKGYCEEKAVFISSGIDESVTLIGSTISVLKPIFLNNRINECGHFLIQKAIRTQSLKKIYDVESISEWSSYFDALGTLVRYECLEKLVCDTFDFLINYLNIPEYRLLIRVNSLDEDLVGSVNSLSKKIKVEYNTKSINYYRHKYGLEDKKIYGRNFNIAILDETDNEYKDVGNIIVIESNSKKYGVELALGANSIIMRKYGIKTSLDASTVSDILKLENIEDYKYAECISVVSNLIYENVNIKNNKRWVIYIFKKYLKALLNWQKYIRVELGYTIEIIKNYIEIQYNIESYDIEEIKKFFKEVI